MAIKTCLMVGGGGWPAAGSTAMTQNFGDRIKIIGLVDVNRDVLDRQHRHLACPKINFSPRTRTPCPLSKQTFVA